MKRVRVRVRVRVTVRVRVRVRVRKLSFEEDLIESWAGKGRQQGLGSGLDEAGKMLMSSERQQVSVGSGALSG